jgi:uncharacterized membrane protein
MLTLPTIILVITATTAALMAGLFYAYSCSVNLGLGRLSDPEYIAAMQSINKSIQNPIFFTTFFGALLLLPFSTYLFYSQPVSMRFLCLLTATIVYLIGVFGVTILGNVPLNEALDVFNLQSASIEEIARQRAKFEGPWNKLNLVRTLASTFVIILVVIACIDPHKISQTE